MGEWHGFLVWAAGKFAPSRWQQEEEEPPACTLGHWPTLSSPAQRLSCFSLKIEGAILCLPLLNKPQGPLEMPPQPPFSEGPKARGCPWAGMQQVQKHLPALPSPAPSLLEQEDSTPPLAFPQRDLKLVGGGQHLGWISGREESALSWDRMQLWPQGKAQAMPGLHLARVQGLRVCVGGGDPPWEYWEGASSIFSALFRVAFRGCSSLTWGVTVSL